MILRFFGISIYIYKDKISLDIDNGLKWKLQDFKRNHIVPIKYKFCKHTWEEYYINEEYVEFEDSSAEWLGTRKVKYRKCRKCGKVEYIY